MSSSRLAAHKIERCRAWHDITSLGMHAWSDDIGRGITSLPLDSTLVRQRRAWHEITAFGQHTRSNDIGNGIPSSPLGSTHGQTTLGVVLYHRLWIAHTVKRCWTWHDITAFGQHKRSKEVGHDFPSPPLHSTHGRTTSGEACHHRP